MSFQHKLKLCQVDDPDGDETGCPSLKVKIQEWCDKYYKSRYSFSTQPPYAHHYIIFENKKDLAHFKAVW